MLLADASRAWHNTGRLRAMKMFDIAVEHWHHLVAARHRQAAAGQKIVLHVDNQQRVATLRMASHFVFDSVHP